MHQASDCVKPHLPTLVRFGINGPSPRCPVGGSIRDAIGGESFGLVGAPTHSSKRMSRRRMWPPFTLPLQNHSKPLKTIQCRLFSPLQNHSNPFRGEWLKGGV